VSEKSAATFSFQLYDVVELQVLVSEKILKNRRVSDVVVVFDTVKDSCTSAESEIPIVFVYVNVIGVLPFLLSYWRTTS